MSSCTTTVPNSVRKSEPVGHTSRHAAWVQCLHTSLAMSQRNPSPPTPSARTGACCSMNATCRQLSAPSPTVLSYDIPDNASPSSGTWFHSLHAPSHALQPMQTLVSVKKPIRVAVTPSQLPSRLVGDAGAPAVVLDEPVPVGAVRTPAGADVAREGLDLLDVDVRVERQVRQLVGRIAGGAAVRAPVVGKADLVDATAPHAQARQPVGDEDARLDRVAGGHDRRPPEMGEATLGGQLGRDLTEH